MKKTQYIKRIIALLTALTMILLTSCSANTGGEELSTGDKAEPEVFNIYNETSQTVKKTETVYVNLDAIGNAKQITVSDWLHADRSGLFIDDTTTLTDIHATRGNYSSFTNDGKIKWHTDSSDVYYEGKSTQPLPVSISIKYFLDGAEIAPADLAGKSGNVKMEISVRNNVTADVVMDGQKVTMYAPLVVLGGMMLSYENFSNIEVTNGMSVGGGSSEIVVLTGAPGINESLKLDNIDISAINGISFSDTYTVSATATDFVLSDIYFAIMPLSELNVDIEMPETLEDVNDILSEIKDIQAVLEKIDPENVLMDFMTDTDKVKEMLDVVNKGLSVYNENEKMLDTMTDVLTPENIATLSDFLSSLDAEEMQSLLGVMSNVPGLQTMMDSLLNLTTSLDEVMPILEKFSSALEDPEVAASMEKLPQTLATLAELMTYLNENKELLDVMTALLSSGDAKELNDVLDKMENGSFDLGSMDMSGVSADAEEIIRRMKPWMQIDYSIFTSAPDYMDTSCMFICKTEPIK